MNWIKIFPDENAASARLPEGRPQLLIVNERRVCLVRFHGEYFATQDTCSHNGESLSKGQLNYLGEIVCPWHNYRFEMRSGRECQSRSRDLEIFPLRIDETGFFIGL